MADEEVLVDNCVKERVTHHAASCKGAVVGYLYGEMSDKSKLIISCIACKTSEPPTTAGQPSPLDWVVKYQEAPSFIPTGISLCGIYYSPITSMPPSKQSIQKVFDRLESEEDEKYSTYIVWPVDTKDESCHCYLYNRDNGDITKCNLTIRNIKCAFMDERITFRIKTTFPLIVEQENSQVIAQEFEKFCGDVLSSSTIIFIKDCNMLLNSETGIEKHIETCKELVSRLMQKDGDSHSLSIKHKGTKKTKEKESGFANVKLKDVIDVKCLRQVTRNKKSTEKESHAPVVLYETASCKQKYFSVSADVLVVVKVTTPLRRLEELIINAVCRQLRQLSKSMETYSKNHEEYLWLFKPYHFKLPGFCHLVSIVHPQTCIQGGHATDRQFELPITLKSQAEWYRRKLLEQLLLPSNKPLLKPCNAYVFDSDKTEQMYLTNPHEEITSSGIADGISALVEGVYSYHHYMQDNFNDDGWGCAYRSLQTICSWFRHQGYTARPVPTHREIQQALVDVGDKEKKFIGSKQWIGSFEVSMCLEHLLDVSSKIMYVNTGAEMVTKGRELLHHFQTQGTPIMIGGGVLAHTILGVDFSEQTGEIRFLILDPHYTGNEDLKIILDKGWCGWKGPNFWNQQAHYNMCMPQRPDMV